MRTRASFPHLERRRAYLGEYANSAREMARGRELHPSARMEALKIADERESFARAIDQELSYGAAVIP